MAKTVPQGTLWAGQDYGLGKVALVVEKSGEEKSQQTPREGYKQLASGLEMDWSVSYWSGLELDWSVSY